MVRSQLKRLIELAQLAETVLLRVGVLRARPLSSLRLLQRLLRPRSGHAPRSVAPPARSAHALRVRFEAAPRYQRLREAVSALMRQAFLRGISARQVVQVLEPVFGDDYVYLFLDGVVLKVRDWLPKSATAWRWSPAVCYPTANAKSCPISSLPARVRSPGLSSSRIST
jgi:hypothetical protein